ncbi:acyltransferase family protein [Actinophytocola sp.]|uniref:acyltransferase family protein n=1 Tax=Actinophytocola sp. TaxID=1872138 RepID=UPI002D808190|nr:acyltransferase family protein [Actinophytocola sp.]HET9141001.1 acyltransferase family protein [Actinophytocola sp.]
MSTLAPQHSVVDAEPQRESGTWTQRADIQGLRALAVGLVLAYHLSPERLPGGFIGVDVFFVISGFLIIGLLVREIRRTGRLRMRDFYARRIRRLLPAASLVLLATVAGTILLLPTPRWPSVLREVLASALDVQNWLLAVQSADYAHATAAASPVQHFWSLSVEEQFYLFIPLLLVVSAGLAAKRGRSAIRWGFGAVAVVTAASLTYSVLLTPAPPGAAYFVTPTRIWELGIGGLLAMVIHRVRLGRAVRLLLGLAGLAAVLVCAVVLTTAMAFPGWVALGPTLGTVALILAGTTPDGGAPARYEVSGLLSILPLRYLGDISYSLYLWHWPVIVFVMERAGANRLTTTQMLKCAALSVLLAALTKHLVEDPFRRRRGTRTRWTYALGLGLVMATVAASIVPWQVARQRMDELLAARSTLDNDHPGARALGTAPSPPVRTAPLVPDPAVADQDMAPAWQENCANYDPANDSRCVYGNPDAAKTMVLLGDSHMTMFSTALATFAQSHPDWRVKLMMHDGCGFGDLPPDDSGYPLRVCADVAYAMVPTLLKMKPDLVVTSGYTLGSKVIDGKRTWPNRDRVLWGYRAVLGPLAEAGIPVTVIRDVPLMATNTPRCLLRNPNQPAACDTPRAVALGPEQDPLVEAVSTLPNSHVVDLTDWLCTPDTCPAVVGNVVVYRDNHLTDSYVRTLTQPLIAQLGVS